jgi:protein unc-45
MCRSCGSRATRPSRETPGCRPSSEQDSTRAVLLKNRAAAYLKLEKYNKVVKDCDEAIEICPTDPKALFRRATALEILGRVEEVSYPE